MKANICALLMVMGLSAASVSFDKPVNRTVVIQKSGRPGLIIPVTGKNSSYIAPGAGRKSPRIDGTGFHGSRINRAGIRSSGINGTGIHRIRR